MKLVLQCLKMILAFAWMPFLGCQSQTPYYQLESEVFYRVFDLQISPTPDKIRWAFITVSPAYCQGLSFGDSVCVSFATERDKLVPLRVDKPGDTHSARPLWLKGEYIGSGDGDSTCMVGFPFKVSQNEYQVTDYVEETTYQVTVSFNKNADSSLVFESMKITNRHSRKPIRFK
ncbi:MAG: hypothetical protein PHR28_10605 [candidate division Zixibacteria bacterium]|nr:hypothetical protein [candidate division Zixibacteria bacterium]